MILECLLIGIFGLWLFCILFGVCANCLVISSFDRFVVRSVAMGVSCWVHVWVLCFLVGCVCIGWGGLCYVLVSVVLGVCVRFVCFYFCCVV